MNARHVHVQVLATSNVYKRIVGLTWEGPQETSSLLLRVDQGQTNTGGAVRLSRSTEAAPQVGKKTSAYWAAQENKPMRNPEV